MNTFNLFITLGCLSFVLTACNAGNGDGLDEKGRPIDEIGDVTDLPDPVLDSIEPTLSSIQEKIFTPICASCHGGANPAAGQDLSSVEDSIANLINITSSNSLFKRVLPGSAEESYLYLKITGDSRSGSRMPLGQPALNKEQIFAIKNWIEDGAMVPEGSRVSAQISRVSLKPIESNKQNTNQYLVRDMDYIWRQNEPLIVVFWFNKPMDFELLTPEQVLLTVYDSEKNNSRLFDSGNVSINIVNDHILQLSIPEAPQNMSHINIQLNKSSISTILTNLGQQLDGDFDDLDGGVFSYDIHF